MPFFCCEQTCQNPEYIMLLFRYSQVAFISQNFPLKLSDVTFTMVLIL